MPEERKIYHANARPGPIQRKDVLLQYLLGALTAERRLAHDLGRRIEAVDNRCPPTQPSSLNITDRARAVAAAL